MEDEKTGIIEVDETTGAVKLAKVDPQAAKVAKRKKERMARLGDIEDELLDDAGTIIRDVHRFNEIEPDATVPPETWIEELGMEGALKRLRVAKAAWMSQSNAPMALKIASNTIGAVLKAKASRDHKDVPRFNVAVVQLPAAAVQDFPRLKVDK